VEWDVSQKVEVRKEMKKKGVFGHHVTHGDVRESHVLILFVLNEP
jgi:hypothetical protein